jgi:hypothetical protein
MHSIAAVRETAERLWTRREETAWILKKQTYLDDATGGACNKENRGACKKENATRLSLDMESIVENGGFT